MSIDLLVDSAEFWNRLSRDISDAQREILIQAMTFEGDSVGLQLMELLLGKNPKCRRRIIIDDYTNIILSDKFFFAPWNRFNDELRRERRNTQEMVYKARKAGIEVRFSNPIGPFFRHAFRRDHKKMVVIDRKVLYIGGINFSEHNFFWHDSMLRVEDSDAAEFLAEDFNGSWNNKNLSRNAEFGPLRLFVFNGCNNRIAWETVFGIIKQARHSIKVHSPYITNPFLRILKQKREEGIEVAIVSAGNNNKPFIKHYITYLCKRYGLPLWYYWNRMSHLKAIVIDDCLLIIGSSNFDYLSYQMLQEIVGVVSDRAIVGDFIARVWDPDIAAAVVPRKISGFTGQGCAFLYDAILRLPSWLK